MKTGSMRAANVLLTTAVLLSLPAGAQEQLEFSVRQPGELGRCIVPLGDLDGDGIDDFGVGSPSQSHLIGTTGIVYVFSGLQQALLRVIPGHQIGDRFGYDLAAVGDLDGDGVQDIVIGAPGHDEPGRADVGAIYYYSGRTGQQVQQYGTGNFPGDNFGHSIAWCSGPGGSGHLAVGSPYEVHGNPRAGKVHVYDFAPGLGWGHLPHAVLYGYQVDEHFGWDLATVADRTNDGREELVVSAENEGNGRGYVHLFASDSYTQYLGWHGNPGSHYGYSIDTADINADGIDDVIVGAPYDYQERGAAWVMNGTDGIIWSRVGPQSGSGFGWDVAGLGDLDADGFEDFAVTNNGRIGAYSRIERISLFQGRAVSAAPWAEILYNKTSPSHAFAGQPYVGGIGDVNGDGRTNLGVGWVQDNVQGWLRIYSLPPAYSPVGLDRSAGTGVGRRNLLENGSFEDGPTLTGPSLNVPAGSNAIPGWGIIGYGLGYVGSPWPAADGDRSLDLAPYATGGVRQVVTTVTGRQYELRFDMAAAPGVTNATAGMYVAATGIGSRTTVFHFDCDARAPGSVGWRSRTLTFEADSDTTTIDLWATGVTRPVLDNISLIEVQNMLSNGSFEDGPTLTSAFVTVAAGSAGIPGWNVALAGVDYIGPGFWEASEGDRSLDLSALDRGAVTQVVATVPGRRYRVAFDAAGPLTSPSSSGITVQVTPGYGPVSYFLEGSGTPLERGWRRRSFEFVATSTLSTLVFETAGGYAGSSGPGLDNVRMTPAPHRSFAVAAPLANSAFGAEIVGLGDVNGDGFGDFAVASPTLGRVDVYSGNGGALLHVLSGNPADRFGEAVGAAGDVNGDGFADVIVGSPGTAGNTGAATVYSGSNGAVLYSWTGAAAGDLFGHAVAGFGDQNRDGYGDVVVGAPGNDAVGLDAGCANTFSGRDGSSLTTLHGLAAGDEFGFAVAAAGDVARTGTQDLLVGAPGADYVTVFPGNGGSVHARVYGTPGSRLGVAVIGGGDYDGDTYPDFAAATAAGEVSLFEGQTARLVARVPGVALGAAAIVRAAGDLNGDGLDDIVRTRFYPSEGRSEVDAILAPGGAVVAVTAISSAAPVSGAGATDVDRDGFDELLVATVGQVVEVMDVPSPGTPATHRSRGAPCSVPGGPLPKIGHRGQARLGEDLFVLINGGVPNSISWLLVGGPATTSLLPYTHCHVLVDAWFSWAAILNGGGAAYLTPALPRLPAFLGVELAFQWWMPDVRMPGPLQASFSDALDVELGY
ncbi:MAG: FG-GAP repeat protein [Planctomycetes bacterium]|nr:FG-GAP repeat protein [Planctomycetota bacterium]